jgi:hypothetical protein
VVNGAGLLGGKTGTTPSIISATRRNYNSNLFVDPMDYRWMRTYSDKPNVRVTVDGIPSACYSDCRYDFISQLPIITGVNITGAVLNLNISDPETAIKALKDITITLDGLACQNLAGSTTVLHCDLQTNADGTPIITAGNHLPVVSVSPWGILAFDVGVSPIV